VKAATVAQSLLALDSLNLLARPVYSIVVRMVQTPNNPTNQGVPLSMQNSIIDANTIAVIVLIKKFIMIMLWFNVIVILYYRGLVGSLIVFLQDFLAA